MGELHVIGAGLGRTGTSSLKSALEMLGLGPCYHMSEALQQPRRLVKLWKRVSEGKEEDMKTILDGFSSVVDYPTCIYFETLFAWNRDSKVHMIFYSQILDIMFS